MAVCRMCHKETSDVSIITCEGNTQVQYPDGTVLKPIPYDPKTFHFPNWYRCPDCNVAPGGKHHSNCDNEHCPKCGGQLISCDCF
jgi:hypothetical protein